ncbi:MAG: outer membrane beta-barrel protein [Deltaproteobacteria bacterium]|nr:outer membrane beta-barrel protein [Deltaproteobacteria bacterium]
MNMKNWDSLLAVSLIISMLCFVYPLGAQVAGPGKGNIKIGPLEVHPFVGLTETYNDNVYRNYGNLKSESDLITTLSPGVQLFLPLQRHNVQLNYRADVNWFSNNSGTNYANQRVGGEVNLDFPGGLIFGLSDYYADAKIPRKAKNGNNSSSDPFRELPYTANDFNVMAKYRFVDRWAVEGRYNNYDYAYKNNFDEGGNYKRDLFGGSLYYRFTPKIDALADYNYAKTKYKTATFNDNKDHSAYVGLSFDPTSKLRGYAKVGWAQKEYDNSLARRNNTFSTFSSLINVTYTLSRYDGLTFIANRQILEDVDTNAPYTSTDVSLWYRHILAWNEKVSLNANAGYGTGKFEQSTTDIDGAIKTRDDKKYYVGAGVGYALQRWLNLGLNYSYTNNDSNFLNYNYKENKVWVSAVAAF